MSRNLHGMQLLKIELTLRKGRLREREKIKAAVVDQGTF